jgi:hypothetical protein
MSGIDLLLNDSRGVYIPRDFALNFINWDGIESEDIEILQAGPEDSDWYWETWDSVLCNASYTDEKGNVWRLHQDGDLFSYCEALMTAEEHFNFFGDHPDHPSLHSDLDADSRFETDNWYDTSAEL